LAKKGSVKINKPKGHPMLACVEKCPLTTFKAVKVVDNLGEESIVVEAI
jgi:hypothetical protein